MNHFLAAERKEEPGQEQGEARALTRRGGLAALELKPPPSAFLDVPSFLFWERVTSPSFPALSSAPRAIRTSVTVTDSEDNSM